MGKYGLLSSIAATHVKQGSGRRLRWSKRRGPQIGSPELMTRFGTSPFTP